MALFRTRKLRKKTAQQQKYLKYHSRLKAAGKLRQAQTFAQWQKSKRITAPKPMRRRKRKPATRAEEIRATRLSRPSQKQLATLPEATYEDVMNILKPKRKRRSKR